MLKYVNYDVVFQEIPDEVTLAINISGCQNKCPGCHSPELQTDIGEPLTEEVILNLLDKYGDSITCVCFMGGDHDEVGLYYLACLIKSKNKKVAVYTGGYTIHSLELTNILNYVKLGKYSERHGPLTSPSTNQRLYRREGKYWEDITYRFWVEGKDNPFIR